VALVPDRDAPLRHGLDQGRLRAGGGPVHLVGEDDVPEERPRPELERRPVLSGPEDLRAGDVGRQEVGRELDAAEGEPARPRERADQQRLPHAGRALEEPMASGQQARDALADRLVLPQHRLGDGGLEATNRLGRRSVGGPARGARLVSHRVLQVPGGF
jgi:hypothetical protein